MKQIAWNEIDIKKEKICALSDEIWEYAETRFEEQQSAKAICDMLRSEGFTVEEGVAGIDTAFTGTFGSGKPVIGFLGEYDALSGMSQEADVMEKQAIAAKGAGHGCGHNLLGCGTLAAAIGVKKYLEKTGGKGTIVYFGCPGEEGGSGKAFMAGQHVFDNVDAVLDWHPSPVTRLSVSSSLANYQIYYKFYGTSAHAGGAPHLGRSALDALELMNMGVQFLREHVIPEARIHYAITNTGGFSPNVVQPYAEVLYLIRAPKNSQVEDIYKRVNKIAEGAAHMTETRVEIDFVKGCSNIVPNKTLAKLMWDNLNEVGVPKYTEEELAYAKELNETVTMNRYETIDKLIKYSDNKYNDKQIVRELQAHRDDVIYNFVGPWDLDNIVPTTSSDVGDVSWNCPTAHTMVTAWTAATHGHSWQVVAQGKSSIAKKGMIYAAKAMAGAAIDLFEKTELLEAAWADFKETLDGETYHCPIPEGCKPRI